MFKVGADPELFLCHKNSGRMVSAHFLEGELGTKQKPLKVEYGELSVDGTAVEFAIDPAKSAKEFNRNMIAVKRQLAERIPDKYTFSYKPCHIFTPKMWKNIPDKNKEIGCEPEFQAPRLNYYAARCYAPIKERARALGGHIHIGWTEGQNIEDPQHKWDAHYMVWLMHNYVSPHMCRAITNASGHRPSGSSKRTYYTGYGRPGAHRVKPYGVEYRVWNSVWVKHDHLYGFLFDSIKAAFEIGQELNYERLNVWLMRERVPLKDYTENMEIF